MDIGRRVLARKKESGDRRLLKQQAANVSAWALRAQLCCAPTETTRLRYELLSFDEVAAAILLPAGFVALRAEGLFLAEANGADAIAGDPQGDEILLNGACAAIAEREVVFGGAALVAVALDGDANLRIVAQEVSRFGEGFAGIRANVCFVEIKIGVADFL